MMISDYIHDINARLNMVSRRLEANQHEGGISPETDAETLSYVWMLLSQIEKPMMSNLVSLVHERMNEALQREADERTSQRPGTPSPTGWQLGGRSEETDPADGGTEYTLSGLERRKNNQ